MTIHFIRFADNALDFKRLPIIIKNISINTNNIPIATIVLPDSKKEINNSDNIPNTMKDKNIYITNEKTPEGLDLSRIYINTLQKLIYIEY